MKKFDHKKAWRLLERAKRLTVSAVGRRNKTDSGRSGVAAMQGWVPLPSPSPADFVSGDLHYRILSAVELTVEVANGTPGTYSGNMVIPPTVSHDSKSYTVAAIGSGAFYGCTNLQSVHIPDSVTVIGDEAFGGCRSLTAVSIPDSVATIGYGAFWGCERLTAVSLPSGITEIDNGVFAHCSGLRTVVLPQRVVRIGDEAFSGCHNLGAVTIPESVEHIGDFAFFGCSSLPAVAIPDALRQSGPVHP